jgi:hypothetical protein
MAEVEAAGTAMEQPERAALAKNALAKSAKAPTHRAARI